MTVIGTLTFRDWDEGCMKTLGAEITQYTVDGDQRNVYAVDVPGLNSGISQLDGKVPCQFRNPEDVFGSYVLPCFQFFQSDMQTAHDRQPYYQVVARGPAKDAQKVTLSDGRVGYTKYENQMRANPFDFSYDLNVLARRKQELYPMLTYALKRFVPPFFKFKVVDSLGDVREYDAGDVTVSNASELVDLAERTIGYTISYLVRAEVDLGESRTETAMLEPNVTYSVFNPN